MSVLANEKQQGKWIVVRKGNAVVCALWQDYKIRQLNVFPTETVQVGNIYVGKVSHIVPSIQAAFIEYLPGQNGYLDLRAYRGAPLTAGSELPVQLQREAVKTKEPVLSANLQLAGKYVIVLHDKLGVSFSHKIDDHAWKKKLRALFAQEMALAAGELEPDASETADISVIVRTNAYEAREEDILAEYRSLSAQMARLEQLAAASTAKTLLYQGVPPFCQTIRDTRTGTVSEIVTDDETLYRQLTEAFRLWDNSILALLKLAEPKAGDYLSLDGRFGVSKEIERALEKRVWLPSGAYLVIEPTEAMTVIDVNSGKAIGKKRPEGDEIFLKINSEAAAEIARQLRLRNLSGMIMIDFIDMRSEDARSALLRTFWEELKNDPVKTVLVDMTKLGIVEVTRKRTHRPLHETIRLTEEAK